MLLDPSHQQGFGLLLLGDLKGVGTGDALTSRMDGQGQGQSIGNGLLTIAKGTVPLAIFGPVGYGLRSGILGAPARATQAASPLLFGLLMDRMASACWRFRPASA